MLLKELFNSGGDMLDQLRQEALDFITPLAGQNIPFTTVQNVIDALKNDQFGLVINRALVMRILDPNEVKAISKIDGDRIYLTDPNDSPDIEDSQDQKQQDAEDVTQTAQDQAQKNLNQ